MKLPREISGKELAKLLKKYGYKIIRQTGNFLYRKRQPVFAVLCRLYKYC